MSYSELFSSINCQRIVFFEDDFKQIAFDKNRMLYDMTRMDVEDRQLFLSEIKAQSPELERIIRGFLESFDSVFDGIGVWRDSVVYGDITSAFPLVDKQSPEHRAELERLYATIKDEAIAPLYGIGAKYGIGVSQPTQYDSIFSDYILYENRAKSYRVYTDFSASTAKLFLIDISESENAKSVVCIIDNQLGDAKRASEIIQAIKGASSPERKNIVGCVFSSQALFEEISKDVYFEYTSKTDVGNLEACLAKSAYNYYLSELKNETIKGLIKAFESAQESKGIAYYLSRKALKEGESEYQIINDWIQLLSANAHAESTNIKHLIALSRVINSLEDTTDEPDASLQKLNTLEAFDYSINDYYLPIAAGDVFTDDKGNWYVLVGQDCDMARSVSRHPRTALAELLIAKVCPQTDFDKWTNDLKTASIYNFRKAVSENSEILQIDYQRRKCIANEIINLCAYNSDGVCRISLSQGLNDEQKALMPQYMIEYYRTLQKYVIAAKTIKDQAKEAFDVLCNPEPEKVSRDKEPVLIRVDDFTENADQVVFGLRRVCRLTHTYVFYLYKLYLEHRGRQPFQTINLVRVDEVSLPVFTNNVKTDYYCTVRRVEDPNRSNPKGWYWFISKNEITRISDLLGFGKPECEKDDIVIDTSPMTIPLPGTKRLFIEKAKDKIKIDSK